MTTTDGAHSAVRATAAVRRPSPRHLNLAWTDNRGSTTARPTVYPQVAQPTFRQYLAPYRTALITGAVLVAYAIGIGIADDHLATTLPRVAVDAILIFLVGIIITTWPKRLPNRTYQRLRSAHHQVVENHASVEDLKRQIAENHAFDTQRWLNMYRAVEDVGLSVMAQGVTVNENSRLLNSLADSFAKSQVELIHLFDKDPRKLRVVAPVGNPRNS